MESVNRKSINTSLNDFDFLAKDSEFIEITEWANGEGWDVVINERVFSLSRCELDAIDCLTKIMDSKIEFKK